MAGPEPAGLDVDLRPLGRTSVRVTSRSVSPAGVRTHRSTEPVPIGTTFFVSGAVIQPSPLPSGICRQSYVGCAFQMPELEPV